jgi:hypothetical protein
MDRRPAGSGAWATGLFFQASFRGNGEHRLMRVTNALTGPIQTAEPTTLPWLCPADETRSNNPANRWTAQSVNLPLPRIQRMAH